jgi:RimJ/RimL family protein N-acetyltransferase
LIDENLQNKFGLSKIMGKKFDILIEGELIDLCVPSAERWVLEQWYQWFNDPTVTQYIEYGAYPNTYEKQEKFYRSLVESNDRIALLIRPKNKDYFVGVASLSGINYQQRQCDFAMVIGKQDKAGDSFLYAVEAKCRMTEHAFEKVGVERINSTQVMDLLKWQRWQVLLGYQIEGILRKKARIGYTVSDVMSSSCLLEDFYKIKELRNGLYWPGKSKMFALLKKLPKESSITRLSEWLKEEHDKNLNANFLA